MLFINTSKTMKFQKRVIIKKGHLVLNVINAQPFMGAAAMYFKDWDAAN